MQPLMFYWCQVIVTAKITTASPNFLVCKLCGKAQFLQVPGEPPKTMRKLCLWQGLIVPKDGVKHQRNQY